MEFLTVAEAAAILKLSNIRVRQLCQTGAITATKFGRDWSIKRKDVEKFKPNPPGRPKKSADK